MGKTNRTAPCATGQAINIGAGAQISVNTVIQKINELLGKEIKPNYVDTRPGDVRHSLADIRLAGELIGYKPAVQFAEGLQKSIEYYKQITE